MHLEMGKIRVQFSMMIQMTDYLIFLRYKETFPTLHDLDKKKGPTPFNASESRTRVAFHPP